MASRLATLVSVALLAGMLGGSTIAMADPSAGDKETARSLMNDGRAARDKGDLKAALKAFAGADSIMHVPTTGLEVAKTQIALGLLVEAKDTALRVSRSQEKPGEPGPLKQARDAASALNDELEGRIPSLTVTLKNVPDGMTATVTLDDAPLPAEVLGQARKLNPGHHVVVAKAGKVDGKQEVDVAEKEQKQVVVELPTQPAAETADTQPPADAAPATTSGKSGTSKALMIGGFAVGGAGLVVGAITGFLTMSKTSSIKSSSACGGSPLVCGPGEFNDISSAKSMATISTVGFIAAGVGAGVGLIGLLTGNSSSSEAAAPASVPPENKPASDESTSKLEPWVGFGAAGLRGTF
jgi:hypothetical protein